MLELESLVESLVAKSDSLPLPSCSTLSPAASEAHAARALRYIAKIKLNW